MNSTKSQENLENYQSFANDFARKIIERDFESAQKFLAVWLQKEISPENLKEIFESHLLQLNKEWEIEELIYPSDFSVSWNNSTLESLKEPKSWREPRQFSSLITEENFR